MFTKAIKQNLLPITLVVVTTFFLPISKIEAAENAKSCCGVPYYLIITITGASATAYFITYCYLHTGSEYERLQQLLKEGEDPWIAMLADTIIQTFWALVAAGAVVSIYCVYRITKS